MISPEMASSATWTAAAPRPGGSRRRASVWNSAGAGMGLDAQAGVEGLDVHPEPRQVVPMTLFTLRQPGSPGCGKPIPPKHELWAGQAGPGLTRLAHKQTL